MRHKEGCLLALSCLFLRTMSQADAKYPFDKCRENQIPRSSAALQVFLMLCQLAAGFLTNFLHYA